MKQFVSDFLIFLQSLALNTCLVTGGAVGGKYAAITYQVGDANTNSILSAIYYTDYLCTIPNYNQDIVPVTNGCDGTGISVFYTDSPAIPTDNDGVLIK